LSPKYVGHPPASGTSVVVDVVLGASEVVTGEPSECFDDPEPPDEHATNRHTDAQNATTQRPRLTMMVYPIRRASLS
jgi:hypothetical protein